MGGYFWPKFGSFSVNFLQILESFYRFVGLFLAVISIYKLLDYDVPVKISTLFLDGSRRTRLSNAKKVEKRQKKKEGWNGRVPNQIKVVVSDDKGKQFIFKRLI